MWLTADEQRIWRQWLSVMSRLPAALNRQLQEEQGISLAEFEVLVHLSEADRHRLRVSALAEALQWEQSRLSHQLGRMEKRGLLERTPCDDDGRGLFASLTAQGVSTIEAAAPGHVAAVRRFLFGQLAADQVGALDDITRAILAGLSGRPAR